MSFVHDLCERTVVLNFGRLIYDGATRGRAGRPGGARGLSGQPPRRDQWSRPCCLKCRRPRCALRPQPRGQGPRSERGQDEIVAVLGANGAGKTLAAARACRARDRRPAARSAFDGEDITQAVAARSGCGAGSRWCRKGRQIVISLTVHENLLMGAYCRDDGDVPRDINAHLRPLSRISAARRSMPASVLSGGEQQMLAIGRALLARPKLMMLDEPSLGLSPLLVERLFELIRALHADGPRHPAGGAEHAYGARSRRARAGDGTGAGSDRRTCRRTSTKRPPRGGLSGSRIA